MTQASKVQTSIAQKLLPDIILQSSSSSAVSRRNTEPSSARPICVEWRPRYAANGEETQGDGVGGRDDVEPLKGETEGGREYCRVRDGVDRGEDR